MNPMVWAAASGLGIAGGMCLIVAGARGRPVRQRRRRALALTRQHRLRLAQLALGAVAGALGWLFTGWVVLIVVVPLAVVGVPGLLGGTRQAQHRIARLEGIEEWVRGLASRLSAGITLEQALVVGSASAPDSISAETRRLAARLRQGQSPAVALRALAQELASPSADQVVAQLLLAYQRRGPGAAQALTQLADWAAQEVANLRAIEAERARPRFTARAVTLIALAAFALLAFTGEYMRPYTSAAGQMVLGLILCGFAGALVWMRRITTSAPQPRLLTPPAAETTRRGR